MRQRGFTLLEVMLVVVVLGILAKVALPYFAEDSRKTRARAEVNAVLAELAAREEAYKSSTDTYLSATACPATTSTTGQDASSCTASGGAWQPLSVALPERKLYCSYTITSGLKGATPTPPSPFDMGTKAQASGWFYIVATCDMDGSSTKNSTYLISSYDGRIVGSNEGY